MLTDVMTLAALRQHHLFGKLPEAAFQEVCNLAISRRLESGDVLFHQGDKAERFYLHQGGGDPGAQLGADRPDIVDYQGALDQGMAGGLQALDQGLPGRVGRQATDIAKRPLENYLR